MTSNLPSRSNVLLFTAHRKPCGMKTFQHLLVQFVFCLVAKPPGSSFLCIWHRLPTPGGYVAIGSVNGNY